MPTLIRKLATLGIILRSIALTIKYSCLVIYHCYKKSQRQQIDQCINTWASALLRVVEASVRIYNPHGVALKPGQPYLLMSNHSSLYDIPLIFEVLPNTSIRMIAKKELFRVPIWGHAMAASEFLAIDRKDSAQAIQDLNQVRDKMRSGIVPWIAPEGTRSRDGKLGPFKKGGFMLAIQTGATIIPIAIKGAAQILPPKTLNFNKGQCVEVYMGKPIDASQYTVDKRMILLQEVRKEIAEMLGEAAG